MKKVFPILCLLNVSQRSMSNRLGLLWTPVLLGEGEDLLEVGYGKLGHWGHALEGELGL